MHLDRMTRAQDSRTPSMSNGRRGAKAISTFSLSFLLLFRNGTESSMQYLDTDGLFFRFQHLNDRPLVYIPSFPISA
jgi:hypothetical protein